MIVKDEEDSLARCLNSVQNIADEIVIVDTGSTDNTKAVASRFTDRIYDFAWIDDFAAARNFAFSCARTEYILWLDADDIFPEEDRNKLIALKESLDPAVDSVTMNYHLATDEYGNVTHSVRRNRLVKRSRQFRWIGAVHEYLEVGGTVLNADIAVAHRSIHHDSDRNLRIYEQRLSRGEPFSPRDLFYFANELFDHRKYEQAIGYYEKFLATGEGWVEDNIAACGKLADCYHELGDRARELDSALRSFQYASPRAEFCCRLGYHFLQQNAVTTAIFWYQLAVRIGQPKEQMGFVNTACSTWLPHLQLCVCYDRIGDYEAAYRHNEIARQYRPEDKAVLNNRLYLETVLAQPHRRGAASREP
jgi:glycosyltransferase involved in cell wall biosynthesis